MIDREKEREESLEIKRKKLKGKYCNLSIEEKEKTSSFRHFPYEFLASNILSQVKSKLKERKSKR